MNETTTSAAVAVVPAKMSAQPLRRKKKKISFKEFISESIIIPEMPPLEKNIEDYMHSLEKNDIKFYREDSNKCGGV
jgi:hypothetical protein